VSGARRIVVAVAGTAGGLVLLFAYPTSRGASADAPARAGGRTAEPQPAGNGSTAGTVTGTFTGDEVQTRWGPVQVRIVVRDGRITAAEAIEYPTENHRDQEINSWAVPQLQEATVTTNGEGVDALSGATVTSEGYLASLQSALDRAHA
jgi:uncharacterized protein with FMN-binding domain